MLINGEVNVLNLFNLRKVNHKPPHFEKAYISTEKNIKHIDLWIYKNLSCRYSCKKSDVLRNNEIVEMIEISFEDSNQLTLFLLSCPFL